MTTTFAIIGALSAALGGAFGAWYGTRSLRAALAGCKEERDAALRQAADSAARLAGNEAALKGLNEALAHAKAKLARRDEAARTALEALQAGLQD